ncbi:MAG: hypothetical protein ACRDOH_21890, partial [Streptosporangiaceae bacterium]
GSLAREPGRTSSGSPFSGADTGPALVQVRDIRCFFGQDYRDPYLPSPAARTISALLTLRDHVIAPILADVRIRRHDHVPTRLTPIDQDYEHLRTDMATLFSHLGIQPGPAAA